MTSSRHPKGRVTRTVALGLLAALGAGLAAGCNRTTTSSIDVADYDYRKRHPILIAEEPETLTLPIGMKAGELSPEIARAIEGFVRDYRESGTGFLTIQVPSGSANEVAALNAGRAAQAIVVQSGVPASLVRFAPYRVGDHAKLGAVQLTFLKLKATTPECGVWPEDAGAEAANRDYFNFGCAYQQNLAAMVANPADLVRPRAEDPANGARRSKVIQDYSQGKETKSESTLNGGNDISEF